MSVTVVGYARVSTKEQKLDVQLDALDKYGCTKIFQEKISSIAPVRPELQNALDWVREGDTLVVTRIDRLARSVTQLHDIIKKLNDKGVKFVAIEQSINTAGSMGKLMITMLGAIAEFELEIRKERQSEGIRMAHKSGIKFGRKEKLTRDQKLKLYYDRKDGFSIKMLMDKYAVSKMQVYRELEKAEVILENIKG